MSKATCKTCGGEVPNHVPSLLDPNGIGDPAHALGEQYDGLREATIASWSRILATYPMTIDMAKDLLEHISTHYNPKAGSFTKAEVLRVLEPVKRKPTHGTCCTCQECGYPYDNECKCDENDFKLRIAEALGLTAKGGDDE